MVCINCGCSSFRFLYKKNGYDIITCKNCGLVSTKILDQSELEKIYDETYFEGGQKDGYGDYIQSEKTLRREFKKTVSLVRELTGYKKGATPFGDWQRLWIFFR